jgi:hypothetical protein
MQYADDTVLCISHDSENALNLKLLLYLFELMSGLKINYQKSEIFLVGGDNNTAEFYSSLFGCQVGTFPMKYLGVPVTFRNLRVSDLDPLDQKFIKKLDAWVGGANSSGGRLTLVNACLSSLPSYFMSLFMLCKTFLEKMDKLRRRFFWHGKKLKRGYYMVKWTKVCRSKKKGGLGILDLHKQNISLLCKWWWKLDTEQGLWQDIVKAKYLRNKSVANVTARFNDSPCWKGLLKVKDTYMVGRKINLRKGNICRLWQDSISGDPPFSLQFPKLFDLCLEKDCAILDASVSDCEIPFRRTLRGDNLLHWNAIKDSLRNLPRSNDSDFITWSLNPKKCFSTMSVYLCMERNLAGSHNKWIWKA